MGLAKKILNFTKVEHTVFSVPLLFAGAWLGAGQRWPSWQTLGLIALAGVGARVLGMAMNRILDRHIDAKNPRTKNRELATGALSLGQALAVAGIGLCLYLAACFALGPLVLKLSPIPALALIGYSLLKRFTAFCHFGIGVVIALSPIGAYVAVKGSLDHGVNIVLLAGFAFLWISGFDIIYALQDAAFDKRAGVHSMPAALGAKGAELLAACVHTIALATLLALRAELAGGPLAGVAVGIAALAFLAAYMPFVPLPMRFFPISAIAGVAGAATPLLAKVL